MCGPLERTVAGLRTRYTLSNGTLRQMQAQSSRLGNREWRPSRADDFSASHNDASNSLMMHLLARD